MKNLKKLTAVLCTLVMLLALCACGNTAAPAADPTEAPAAEESSAPSDDVAADQTFVVGICQLVQHDALDAATEGFKQALTDKLGDKVTFQEGNASGDPATCSVIVNQFVSDDVDLIMANATPALLAAVAATNEIPILGTSVTDYGSALEISDWTGATGFNVSGTSDLAPLDGQAAVLKELCPDAKVVGILYCSGEPNSKFQADTITPMFEELGGAKVSDKLNVINNLLDKVDTLIILGGMAYTFVAAKGYGIGKSLFDAEKVDYCKKMLEKAEEKGVKLLLPVDTVVAKDFPDPIDGEIEVKTVDVTAIPDDMEGLDIGEKTRALFADAVKSAKTVVWNGPMGVFENPTLAKGTIAVAQALVDSDAVTIVGGGDSAAAVEKLGFASKITHISTGGGASLEFLEGKELPGVACLLDK